jgi:hypothetical protein
VAILRTHGSSGATPLLPLQEKSDAQPYPGGTPAYSVPPAAQAATMPAFSTVQPAVPEPSVRVTGAAMRRPPEHGDNPGQGGGMAAPTLRVCGPALPPTRAAVPDAVSPITVAPDGMAPGSGVLPTIIWYCEGLAAVSLSDRPVPPSGPVLHAPLAFWTTMEP